MGHTCAPDVVLDLRGALEYAYHEADALGIPDIATALERKAGRRPDHARIEEILDAFARYAR